MTNVEIATLFKEPGLYVLNDTRVRGCTVPILSLADDTQVDDDGKPKVRAFQLQACGELSPDPENWHKAATASLAGGPFSTQMCQQLDEQAEKLFDLETAVCEAKEHARLYRDVALSQGLSDVAHAMQIILDTLTPEAEKPLL
jgi:hypothetical protein